MSKEQKVNRKDILSQLESIKEKTEELAAIVATLPECYVQESYATSVKNLQKKNENFLTFGDGKRKGLTDEEKEVLAAMRAGKKVEISEVPAESADSENSEAPVVSKKSKKNH